MSFHTTDLSDAHPDVQVADPLLLHFGGIKVFSGQIATAKVHEDNVIVRSTLETAGEGRVLVVDGGGSTRTALVGDVLAGLGLDNGWSGIVVNGCVRDSAAIAELDIGVMALSARPNRSAKHGFGELEVPVFFAGVAFHPGAWLYADHDGILVSDHALT